MKPLLALVTLALTALVLEEKAREVAGDAQDAYGQAVVQARCVGPFVELEQSGAADTGHAGWFQDCVQP